MKHKKQLLPNRNLILKTYLFGVLFSFLFMPFFAYAATTYSQDLFGLFNYALAIIDDLILWLFTTGAVLLFIWFIVKRIYDLSQGKYDPSGGNKYIIWGLVALTLMFTFYAVVGLIAVTFGIQIGIPQFFGGENALGGNAGNVNRSYSIINR